MFCNQCGKTLHLRRRPAQAAVSRLATAAGLRATGTRRPKVRFVPEGGERPGYAPYTKTTYSSMSESGDVYSRTSYRPALSEEESRETTGLRDSERGQEEPAA